LLEHYRPTPPSSFAAIDRDTKALGFTMASDVATGSFLRALAATKPGGAFLELGTGTGLATAWMLDGMDAGSTLVTVDNDEAILSVARKHLGGDPRLTFVVADGASCLATLRADGATFDVIFADAMPGKYTNLDDALELLRPGGLYVIDDMLPQPNWPAEHPPKVAGLIETLAARADLCMTALDWSTGIIVASKRGGTARHAG
jgi:predicted O-methyltransferase YrrM